MEKLRKKFEKDTDDYDRKEFNRKCLHNVYETFRISRKISNLCEVRAIGISVLEPSIAGNVHEF